MADKVRHQLVSYEAFAGPQQDLPASTEETQFLAWMRRLEDSHGMAIYDTYGPILVARQTHCAGCKSASLEHQRWIARIDTGEGNKTPRLRPALQDTEAVGPRQTSAALQLA